MKISEFQKLMADIYVSRDSERGVSATVAWLVEEVGELAKATRKGTYEERLHDSSARCCHSCVPDLRVYARSGRTRTLGL